MNFTQKKISIIAQYQAARLARELVNTYQGLRKMLDLADTRKAVEIEVMLDNTYVAWRYQVQLYTTLGLAMRTSGIPHQEYPNPLQQQEYVAFC